MMIAFETSMPAVDDSAWLRGFHLGERPVLEACYREYYVLVFNTARRYLPPVDAETAVHEVFLKLLADPAARASFQGGSLAAWLSRVATNHALRMLERQHREVPTETVGVGLAAETREAEVAEARMMLERFRREVLPEKWAKVFEARFVRGLDQRSAARELGMFRTTLAYQELRIRSLLRAFFVEGTP